MLRRRSRPKKQAIPEEIATSNGASLIPPSLGGWARIGTPRVDTPVVPRPTRATRAAAESTRKVGAISLSAPSSQSDSDAAVSEKQPAPRSPGTSLPRRSNSLGRIARPEHPIDPSTRHGLPPNPSARPTQSYRKPDRYWASRIG